MKGIRFAIADDDGCNCVLVSGGVGRQHGELQRVEDEDPEQDRGDDAARESPRLRLLPAGNNREVCCCVCLRTVSLNRMHCADGGIQLHWCQLRSGGGGTRKRLARPDQAEFNVGWSWLERWMATRQGEPAADDCMSRNADAGSAGRRVVVVRRRGNLAGEEKESCGSNDVSVVSFDGSSSLGGRSGLSCHKPGRSRLKGARGLPRRKVASSDHRYQARSHKVKVNYQSASLP